MKSARFLIPLLFLPTLLAALSVTLESDRATASVGEQMRVTLTLLEEGDGSAKEVQEPPFTGFEMEHRGESTSSSISIINGKMNSRKERRITFVLRPRKEGVFPIGPATVISDKGGTVRSNQLRITVSGGGTMQSPAPSATVPTPQEPDQAASGGGNALLAPLSAWEKKTGRYFIRVVVSPDTTPYRGEPLIVSYYLFTQPNTISDLSFYRFPAFENAWSDELASPRKLSFERTAIEGTVYDYALVKSYALIPDANAERVTATQMILDVMTGSFFDARKRSLSSVALSLTPAPLPDADRHPGGVYGDLTLTQDRDTLTLDRTKPLDTVTYTFSGCGNLQQIELKPPDIPGLLLFAPDITLDTRVEKDRLCGAKSFKFMIKGRATGAAEIPPFTVPVYHRDNGWRELRTRPVRVTVAAVAADGPDTTADRSFRYELLREIPAGLAVYDLTPLTERRWFRIVLAVPIGILIAGLLFALLRTLRRGRREGDLFQRNLWIERVTHCTDPSTLLNVYYDALAAITGISLKGEQLRTIEKRCSGRVAPLIDLARRLQYATYAADAGVDLAALKREAAALLRTARRER